MAGKSISTDATASTKQLKRGPSPSVKDTNDVPLEVNFIVVDDQKMDEKMESTEFGQTNGKRLRLEIEPLPNQANKSSQNETKIPSSIRKRSEETSKSIEELVSSSEAFDTNNEDKYFVLSILGTMRRLTPHKRALARCHILSYLTEIEYGNSNSIP